jgi:hypothetical protein
VHGRDKGKPGLLIRRSSGCMRQSAWQAKVCTKMQYFLPIIRIKCVYSYV